MPREPVSGMIAPGRNVPLAAQAPAASWEREQVEVGAPCQAILTVAPDAAIESCTAGFLRVLGLPAASEVRFSELFPDEERARLFLTELAGKLQHQGVVHGYAELRRPASAELIPVTYQASALLDRTSSAGKGPPRRVVLVVDPIPWQSSDESPFPVLRVSLDGILLSANRGSWLLLEHWGAQVGDRLPPQWKSVIDDAVRRRDNCEAEIQIGVKNLLLVVVPVIDRGYVTIFGLDVTGRKQAEKRLLIDSQIFENASEAVVIMDADTRILDVNRAFTTITGHTREEILGEQMSILSSVRHEEAFYEGMWNTVRSRGSWQGEVWVRRRSGETFPTWLSVSAVRDEVGKISRYIGLFSDISAMKRTQEQLYEMAHYDSLTGLPNRRFFLDRLKENLDQARRNGASVALMLVDLDGFKNVNDDLGHQTGDLLLREVAGRIRQCVRESDSVARMGGDEFTVILPHVGGSDGAVTVARKILHRIYEPVRLADSECFISGSIGIALFPEDAADVDALLQSADTALYKAKDLGKNGYQFFSREMNRRAIERLTLQTQIRQGLGAEEFLVYYQPQLEAETGRLVALEALARWRSPQIGLVSPEHFIPLAEETGLIQQLGERVLRSACLQGRLWLDRGIAPLRIGINISAHQLRRSDFVPLIESILRDTGFPASLLELELAEGMLIDEVADDLDKLGLLKAAGVVLAIDNFGTKFSSFAYLRKLQIDRLKIDKSFVQDLPDDLRVSTIVSAIIAMSRSLNVEVVAEGVETGAQAALLRTKGCHLLQGYWCGRPFPAENLEAFLETAGSRHT